MTRKSEPANALSLMMRNPADRAPESLNVQVFGPVAIATGVMRVKGVDGGKACTRRERFVDTWLYKGGHWGCVGTDATPVLH